ncbi:hypothetical protein C1S82_24860 [Mycolicibacterium cosmeticum]|nr:hypothetical protein [Mycolicibacterium cosmeticum]TLH69272.1 hypothetical protein C1S82_24860 [Mycolicibacterium cosmeticum]
MGGRFAGGVARQHPDLTTEETDGPAWVPPVMLSLLSLDGVLSAVLAAFLLPWRVSGAPFPVSVLISGLVNAALVWAALQWTLSPRVGALPLWCWLATIGALTLGGPGSDIVFGLTASGALLLLLLVVVGVLPPLMVLRRYARGR